MADPALIDHLLAAADRHGDDTGDPDMTIGDLQQIARALWANMEPAQRAAAVARWEIADIMADWGPGG